MPQRIQRQRTKGWRKPSGAVYVGRGSKWGNPYRVADGTVGTPRAAVWRYRDLISMCDRLGTPYRLGFTRGHEGIWTRDIIATIRAELAGRDLMCWCPLTDSSGQRMPCHADVLLELANRGEGK